jgi:hypothetical protein
MTQQTDAPVVASPEEIQKGWHELVLRVAQLEADRSALQQENKSLRMVLERVIEYRQKSHTELVLMLTNLVSKLPLNDSGVIVSRLVEHNANVNQYLAALGKGTADAPLPEPAMLKTLDHTKRELAAEIKPLAEELIRLEAPLPRAMVESFATQPEEFFAPHSVRACRCYVKGYIPRERVLKEFGQDALVLFVDRTTDPKLNPHPKAEEIALEFRPDFEEVMRKHPDFLPDKREDITALFMRVQGSKQPELARQQKHVFARLTFLEELLHYYVNAATESSEVLCASRLPVLVEQFVLVSGPEVLEEKLVVLAEGLLGHIISPAHRQMVINNVGKGGGIGKTLKFILRFRSDKLPPGDPDNVISDFLKHILPPPGPWAKEKVAPLLRLLAPDLQMQMLKHILRSDRMPRDMAEALAKGVAEELGLKAPLEEVKAEQGDPSVAERLRVWARIKDMITQRADASLIAEAIRDRLRAKYDADEIKQSWVTLTEADPLSLIRVVSHIPYLADGRTDPIARTIIDIHVGRLTHEKYHSVYKKVVNSLKSMHSARPDNPTLQTFIGLVKWVNPEAAAKLCSDIGMQAPP